MKGNPYVKAAHRQCDTADASNLAAAVMALAYEQRTANILQNQMNAQLGEIARLLAPSGHPQDPSIPVDEQVEIRLGLDQ